MESLKKIFRKVINILKLSSLKFKMSINKKNNGFKAYSDLSFNSKRKLLIKLKDNRFMSAFSNMNIKH